MIDKIYNKNKSPSVKKEIDLQKYSKLNFLQRQQMFDSRRKSENDFLRQREITKNQKKPIISKYSKFLNEKREMQITIDSSKESIISKTFQNLQIDLRSVKKSKSVQKVTKTEIKTTPRKSNTLMMHQIIDDKMRKQTGNLEFYRREVINQI